MEAVGSVREWADLAASQERGEDNTIPRFYMRAVQDHAATQTQGRPIFKEVPFVEIIVPGDKNARPDCKVTDEHRKRWPSQWQKFEATREEVIEGTPIEAWPFLNRAQVAEFKALGILTVESLAGLDDLALQKLGPYGRQMRERAQQFLKPPSETEADLRQKNRDLENQVNALEARLASLEKSSSEHAGSYEGQPKKRGRPPKVPSVDAA